MAFLVNSNNEIVGHTDKLSDALQLEHELQADIVYNWDCERLKPSMLFAYQNKALVKGDADAYNYVSAVQFELQGV